MVEIANEFDNFVLNNIEKSNEHNFYVFVKPNKNFNTKSFKLVSTELSTFWEKYCELSNKEYLKLYYGEVIPSQIPIIVKAELTFDSNISEKSCPDDLYTEDFIKNMVKVIQETIYKNFVGITQKELLCCVLEYPEEFKYTIDKTTQNYFCNIVFMFPYCRVEKKIQQTIFRTDLIRKITYNQGDLYSTLIFQPKSNWDTIIPPLYDDFYPLYGSLINPEIPNSILTHVYIPSVNNSNQLNDMIDILESYPTPSDNNILNPYYHSKCLSSQINIDFSKAPIKFWLPFILSLDYCTKITSINPELSKNLVDRCPFTPRNESKIVDKFNVRDDKNEEEIELCKLFIQYLTKQRCNEKNYWLDVGKAIYNTYDGNNDGLKLWYKFTESSDIFTEDDCDDYYDKFNFDNYLDYRTIAFYARLDSPEEYKRWHDSKCKNLLLESVKTKSDYDIAKAFYSCYWLEYCCKEINEWYKFRSHKWIKLHKDDEISNLLSHDFKKNYEYIRCEISKQIAESDDDIEKEKMETIIKNITTVVSYLMKNNKKTAYIKEMTKFFYDEKMIKYENKNKPIFAIKNGIIETTDTEAVIRDGKPQDYITMYTPNSYPLNIRGWNDQKVVDIMDWMIKVFGNYDEMNYFLLTITSRFKSGNDDKMFFVWTGSGDNSKSCVGKLIEYTFGPYCFTGPATFLYFNGQNNSAPTDVLKQAQYCKIVFFPEPAAYAVLDEGLVKGLTGNDTNYFRGMYKDGGNMEIFFSIIIMCNTIPRFMNPDKALKKRQGILHFGSAWVDGLIQDDYVNRKFIKDPDFGNKIKYMAPTFLWILRQKYQEYTKYRLSSNKPAAMISFNKNYWNNNDPCLLFIKENIEAVKKQDSEELDETIILKSDDIYYEFKSWYIKKYPKTKIHTFDIFINLFKTEFDGYDENISGWAGYRLKNSENMMMKF